MPSHASANPQIKQLYINGHFCYVFKFGIVTNGLGVTRQISFYNKDFLTSHPDIVVNSPYRNLTEHDQQICSRNKSWICNCEPDTKHEKYYPNSQRQIVKDFLINFTKNSQLGQKNRARNLYLRFLAL